MKTKLILGFSLCFVALCAAFVLSYCNACSTTTGDPAKDARGRATNQALKEAGTVLGKVAVSVLYTAAVQEATGGKVDFQQSATQALWANVNLADTSAAVHNIVMAYSGGKAPETAKAAAEAVGDQVTPAKVDAVAKVISTATGAPPAI